MTDPSRPDAGGPDPTVDPVARLEAIEAIRRLKARYFRFIDTKRWEEWGALFTDDATMDVSDDAAGTVLRGRDDIVAVVSGFMDPSRSAHHGHQPEIDLTGPTTATGIWAMDDDVELPDGDGSTTRRHGWGWYHDEYRLEGGTWRISSTRLERIRIDRQP